MGRLATLSRQVSWYVGSLMGDNHYQRYVALRARTHPDEAAMSERDYWRMRYDATERNPQSRCC